MDVAAYELPKIEVKLECRSDDLLDRQARVRFFLRDCARPFPHPDVRDSRDCLLGHHAARDLVTKILFANRYRGIWIVRREFLLYGALALAAVALVSHLRCDYHPITMPTHPLAVALLLACAAFPFEITIERTLVLGAVQSGAKSTNERLIRHFATRDVALWNVTGWRNLLGFHLECAERRSFGFCHESSRM
jgi:hypothetical protein